MPEPNLESFYDQLCSRYAWDFGALSISPGIASGIVFGANPPYGPAEFLAMYPKFAGSTPPMTLTGTLIEGSPVVTVDNTANIPPGRLVGGAGIPPGTFVASQDSDTQLTLTQSATNSIPSMLTVYDPAFLLVPLPVLNAYIALASASVLFERWQEAWGIGLALFIAHYLTLWLRSEGSTFSTPGKAAAAGLAQGITVSKSAGPLSKGIQPVTGLESWASWNETSYGLQFATMAKVIGMGPIWVG